MDEPIITSVKIENKNRTNQTQIDAKKATEKIMAGELYGVLATQNNGHPYTSLMAYGYSSDLKKIVFITPKTTRKYQFLEACNNVAFQVDNRPKIIKSIMTIESLTATGTAYKVDANKKEYNYLRSLLLSKHHYLEYSSSSPSSALYCIKVKHLFHVVRLQEVSVITP
ncbi:hypothetical protein DID80_05565 [Candidatus Marinamargulisbacteria bacterium SCGC AAA071-K20]|nr:hypothetical protein DID80_05565 [Candidatus Marinamargulisbacteria bacterium SCGC AAA071-K20]